MVMNTLLNSSPQILSGTVVLSPGQTQTVSLEAMASRSGRWLRLEELSLAFYEEMASLERETVFSPSFLMGSVINVRARAYRQDLMLDYVPTWLIGPRLHVAAEQAVTSASAIPYYGVFETYRWKFPKPFYLPPGSAFVVQLQRDSYYDDSSVLDINAQVVVRATQLSEQEARAAMTKGRDGMSGNPIPYIAAYAPRSFPNKSNNLDLANPFLVPLYLQRMTGRMLTGDNGINEYGMLYGPTVKLTDTRTVICDPTQMITIFPRTHMAWTHTRVLQPGEYITAELTKTTTTTPSVAIIGYRNEVLP